jgi:hypothetical protein
LIRPSRPPSTNLSCQGRAVSAPCVGVSKEGADDAQGINLGERRSLWSSRFRGMQKPARSRFLHFGDADLFPYVRVSEVRRVSHAGPSVCRARDAELFRGAALIVEVVCKCTPDLGNCGRLDSLLVQTPAMTSRRSSDRKRHWRRSSLQPQ